MESRYNKIGKGYNQTRKADPYLLHRLMAHLKPKPQGKYLDIGCGTGNYSIELKKQGVNLMGIDPSSRMLQVARKKMPEMDWRSGSAEKTGLESNSLDGILASLTIHHWSNLTKAFEELSRILKFNGKIVIFTSTPLQMKGYWLNHYFPKMLQDSILQMPSYESVEKAMLAAGLGQIQIEKYFVKPDLQDKFLYCGKENPSFYLDPQIRKGISSFSYLANQTEVQEGLKQLERDIDKGKIQQIMNSYQNEHGDYLFVMGTKQGL